ncbi:hypothetical protein ACBQ24_05215 [Acinetobacter terrestris]|uniref:hypothetical protein n=1 Tax=Acinetobacter terrestris TaxID=2529843 RepID=UPI00352596D9
MNQEIIDWAIELSSKAKLNPRFAEEYQHSADSQNAHCKPDDIEALSNHFDTTFLEEIKTYKHLSAF